MVFTNYRPKSHKIKEFGGMVKAFFYGINYCLSSKYGYRERMF